MSASAEAAAERRLFATAAALLGQGRAIDRLSRPLTVIAVALLLVLPAMIGSLPPAFVVVLVLVALAGCAQAWYALRVGFDAALFRHLAEGTGPPDLPALDAALSAMGLLPPARRGRSAAERVAGARRLLLRQAAMLVVQLLLVLLGAAVALRT